MKSMERASFSERLYLEQHYAPLLIELVLSAYLLVDIAVKFRVYGVQIAKSHWVQIQVTSISVLVANNIIAVLCQIIGVTSFTLVGRVLRPLIVIVHFRNVRRILSAMFFSVPKIFRVIFLLVRIPSLLS